MGVVVRHERRIVLVHCAQGQGRQRRGVLVILVIIVLLVLVVFVLHLVSVVVVDGLSSSAARGDQLERVHKTRIDLTALPAGAGGLFTRPDNADIWVKTINICALFFLPS